VEQLEVLVCSLHGLHVLGVQTGGELVLLDVDCRHLILLGPIDKAVDDPKVTVAQVVAHIFEQPVVNRVQLAALDFALSLVDEVDHDVFGIEESRSANVEVDFGGPGRLLAE